MIFVTLLLAVLAENPKYGTQPIKRGSVLNGVFDALAFWIIFFVGYFLPQFDIYPDDYATHVMKRESTNWFNGNGPDGKGRFQLF